MVFKLIAHANPNDNIAAFIRAVVVMVQKTTTTMASVDILQAKDPSITARP